MATIEFQAKMIHKKIMQGIQGIPEDKLTEIYAIIHYFRLDLNLEAAPERQPGLLKGSLGKKIFDALPEDELKAWE